MVAFFLAHSRCRAWTCMCYIVVVFLRVLQLAEVPPKGEASGAVTTFPKLQRIVAPAGTPRSRRRPQQSQWTEWSSTLWFRSRQPPSRT